MLVDQDCTGEQIQFVASGNQAFVDMIVKSAAMATGCDSSVFLRGSAPEPLFAARYGQSAWCAMATATALLNHLIGAGDRMLIIDDMAVEGCAPETIVASCLGFARFLSAVPVLDEAGTPLGVLVIADAQPRPGLSKAQQYVLWTYATQLRILIGAHAPQAKTSSETQHAAERLRLLESVVVNANDAVLITEAEPVDLPGPRIVYCNRAFERTTGYLEAEILGKTPRILQSPDIDRPALRRLKEALTKWRPVEVELLNVRKDGTEFWVELSIVPVTNEKGWYTHWVSVQRDVSDRKKSEEIATRARIAEAENKALEADLDERKRIEAQLFYEAFHDDLTKLRNRAYFMNSLSVALSSERENGGNPNCVLFLDLDGFKLVNDSLGHREGDELLIVTADRLRGCLQPADVLARIGGDEFAILLSRDDPNAGVEVAERILKSLREPVMLANQRVFPSCSVGIAMSSGGNLKPDDFLRNADIAMYKAKKRGVGGYVVFTPSMYRDVSAALALRMDLRQAIARREFQLHYQLICDPRTSRVSGVEALVRWQHPTRGIVSPLEFVPVAEETSVIREIGRWVLMEACAQLSVWNGLFGCQDIGMSVNVSGDELRDPDFGQDLRMILAETGVDARQLQLEITESVFLRQPDVIGIVLEDIRSCGVRIALDDFGTGFSSLSCIDQYPIDTIKIDRSFIARMLSHRRTLAIIETIIRLGRALDLQIVAEGVETDAQRETLTSLHCSHAQGFLFAEPMTASEATAVIAAQQDAQTQGALGLQRQLGRVWG